MSPSARRPPEVLSLEPLKTSALAKRPRATFDTRLAFMALLPAFPFMPSVGSTMRAGAEAEAEAGVEGGALRAGNACWQARA
mmetsp:Transcript_76798/g.232819  ORF Transcript_76798/g.232819 Transcript_76798/m.232819 type:complete len:82 (-) Transcript_76798:2-247(-)